MVFTDFALIFIYWYSWLELYIKKWFFSHESRKMLYIKDNIEYKHPELNYDFVITTQNKLHSINLDQFEESNGKFIFTEITFSNEKIKINFKTDTYNYYLVGNVFDKKFIVYFMKRYYFRIVDDYTIKIIDNDVNTNSFDETRKVVFSINGYSIE